jgi:hypothetical protein
MAMVSGRMKNSLSAIVVLLALPATGLADAVD